MPANKAPERFKAFKLEAVAWFRSLRFSALTLILLAVTVAAAFILTPNISIYVQQKRQIAALETSVEMHKQALTESEAEKLKWQDPVFIKAQARERLYYVMPGEKQLSVIKDGVQISSETNEIYSNEIIEDQVDWLTELTKSFIQAGVTTASPQQFRE